MNYTVEEVRARVKEAWQNHDEQGRVFITMGDAMALVEIILPERIEADETKALGTCPKHGVEYVGECSGCAMTLPEKDFTHPPPQSEVTDEVVDVAYNTIFDHSSFEIGESGFLGKPAVRAALLAIWPNPPAQSTHVDPAEKPRTLADFVHAPDAERAQIGQQVAARVGEMMTEPVTQDDCPVCGCVHDGRCLCTKPHVVPVAQGEVFMQVLASLVAAVSLLRSGGRKAASSDTMFALMLSDYEKAIKAGRTLLAATQPREPS